MDPGAPRDGRTPAALRAVREVRGWLDDLEEEEKKHFAWWMLSSMGLLILKLVLW